MSKNIKANKVRTSLLLKTQSEIDHFLSLPTKINSISVKLLYEFYSHIEINIKNPYEYFLCERKNSIGFLMEEESFSKKEDNDFTPILEYETQFKIKKKLISDRKNKNFLEQINNNNNNNESPPIKRSDKNDISMSFSPKKKKSTKISIQYLRQIAKNFIKRKKHERKSISYYKNQSQKNIIEINIKSSKKNSNKLYKSHVIGSTKNVNSSILYAMHKEKSISPTKKNNNNFYPQDFFLVHANSTSTYAKENLRYRCKNLLLQNTSMSNCIGPSFNRRTFTLKNIQIEKDKLKKNDSTKIIFTKQQI